MMYIYDNGDIDEIDEDDIDDGNNEKSDNEKSDNEKSDNDESDKTTIHWLEEDDPNYENKLRIILDSKDKPFTISSIIIESGNYKGFSIMMEKYKTFENIGISNYDMMEYVARGIKNAKINGDGLKILNDLVNKYNYKTYYSSPNKFNDFTFCFEENEEMLRILCYNKENMEIALDIAYYRQWREMIRFLEYDCIY
jgi:hypothetical protein